MMYNFSLFSAQRQLELVFSHWRQETEDALVRSQLCYTLHLIGIWVSWRRGSRIMDKSSLCKVNLFHCYVVDNWIIHMQALHPLLLEATLSKEVEKTLLHLVASLLLVSTVVEADLLSIIHDVRGVMDVFNSVLNKNCQYTLLYSGENLFVQLT